MSFKTAPDFGGVAARSRWRQTTVHLAGRGAADALNVFGEQPGHGPYWPYFAQPAAKAPVDLVGVFRKGSGLLLHPETLTLMLAPGIEVVIVLVHSPLILEAVRIKCEGRSGQFATGVVVVQKQVHLWVLLHPGQLLLKEGS